MSMMGVYMDPIYFIHIYQYVLILPVSLDRAAQFKNFKIVTKACFLQVCHLERVARFKLAIFNLQLYLFISVYCFLQAFLLGRTNNKYQFWERESCPVNKIFTPERSKIPQLSKTGDVIPPETYGKENLAE